MTFRALKEQVEILEARDRLAQEGLLPSRWMGGPRRWLRYILQGRALPPPPDVRKCWDLDLALSVIRRSVDTSATVLDLGAYNSAILPALHRLGYRNLVGVDLNPKVVHGPNHTSVRYLVGDIYAVPLASQSVDVVTAISTMEHGWRGEPFFSEVARLLRPGGLLLASTDYWPRKVDTAGSTAFGLSWSIFSESEVSSILDMAAHAGLMGAGPVDFTVGRPVIEWNGRRYTFGFLCLVRSASETHD